MPVSRGSGSGCCGLLHPCAPNRVVLRDRQGAARSSAPALAVRSEAMQGSEKLTAVQYARWPCRGAISRARVVFADLRVVVDAIEVFNEEGRDLVGEVRGNVIEVPGTKASNPYEHLQIRDREPALGEVFAAALF